MFAVFDNICFPNISEHISFAIPKDNFVLDLKG